MENESKYESPLKLDDEIFSVEGNRADIVMTQVNGATVLWVEGDSDKTGSTRDFFAAGWQSRRLNEKVAELYAAYSIFEKNPLGQFDLKNAEWSNRLSKVGNTLPQAKVPSPDTVRNDKNESAVMP